VAPAIAGVLSAGWQKINDRALGTPSKGEQSRLDL